MVQALLDKCMEMTPVHQGKNKGCWYKRDDLFRPFEDSPINGTKLRQCFWLMNNLSVGYDTVVSASSVKSPQLPLVTKVAKAFDKEVIFFIGSQNMKKTAEKNPMVRMAVEYGAELRQAPCAYNSALQKTARDYADEIGAFLLEYGISTTDPKNWYNFYTFGGHQTRSIPKQIKSITMTAGSCNSALSVLIGLFNQTRLLDFKFNLVGIGPSKFKLLQERFEHATGMQLPVNNFVYYDIHDKLYTYDQRVNFNYDGINFHPRYEAKMMTFLHKTKPHLLQDNTNLIWIVGSEDGYVNPT